MSRCRFCDHRNPPGARSCSGCGAELPVEGSAGESLHRASPPEDDFSGIESRFERQILSILTTQGKIAAIKEHRNQTGAGLKESKDAVEALAARYGVRPGSGARAGCTTGMLLLALAGIAAWNVVDRWLA